MTERNSKRLTLRGAIPGLAALAGFALVLLITSGYGPGLDPDSMAYVGSAQSLARGGGLRVPLGKWEQSDSTVELTTWPPAFPMTMALPQAAGLAPIASARMVIAACAAVTAAIVATLFVGVVSVPVVVAGLTVILVTPSFVSVHMSILSEPLFLAALALTLFGMVRGRPGIAAVAAALAVMTRYAGASAAVAAAAWFLFFENGDLRRRVFRAALSSAPAALAFVLWMIHNSHVKVVQSAIKLGYYPGIGSTLREGATTLLSWIAPGASVWAGILIAIAVCAGLVASRRVAGRPASVLNGAADFPGRRITTAAAVLLTSYIAVLICSRLFVGGAIAFDGRILSPAIFLLEVALIPLVAKSLRRAAPALRRVGAFALAAWMVAAISAEYPIVLDSIQDGNDFAASDWRESPTVEWIVENGTNRRIYTNWPAAVFFDAHRNAYDIPSISEPDTLALFGKILEANHGVVATFNERNSDYPPIDSIALGAGLVKLQTLDDGVIWGPHASK